MTGTVAAGASSMPEQQNEDDDRDRNPEQPQKNAATYVGSPRFSSEEFPVGISK